jgi:hypothetical protein
MDALMRVMRQTHHDPMNTSMFDAEAYRQHGSSFRERNVVA